MQKINWKAVRITICAGDDLSDMPPDLPACEYLDASGCTALAALPDLPACRTLDARGCTALAAWMPKERIISFLTGGGKSIEECCGQDHWQCHSWNNCPTRAAYGVGSISDLPEKWRSEAAIFIGLFDAGLLTNPIS